MSNLKAYLDEPKTELIGAEEFEMRGWFGHPSGILSGLVLRTSSGCIRFSVIDRPDVQGAFPHLHVFGFTALVRLRDHLASIRNKQLTVFAVCGSSVVTSFRFQITPAILTRAIQRTMEY